MCLNYEQKSLYWKLMKPTQPLFSFSELGIAKDLLKRLDDLHFKIPTPIQHQAIPIAITGEDVIGIAQTGTGKTIAFAVPMIQRLAALKKKGLVLLPTRELAHQVNETFQKIGGAFSLRTVVLIGGQSIGVQIHSLRSNPNIIIATPGRLIDHLNQGTVRLDTVAVLVLDEADRMLDMGFEPQIRRILKNVPQERQTMLFSATMPGKISQLANTYMKKPLRVEVAPAGTAAELVEHEVFIVPKEQKTSLLGKLLGEYQGTVLVFSRTKHGAKKIARVVAGMGHKTSELHSNRSLSQRMEAMKGFRSGKYRVLIATDIAARGIDVTGIEVVINYDLPENSDDYVHRIGRTGRAGKTGKAISFAAPDQRRDIQAIERLIRTRLPITPLPELPKKSFEPRVLSTSQYQERAPAQSHGYGRRRRW